jgi:peptidoglycan biosynthesis protein MviN/MurJ (putative lipid II flippase)
MKRLLGILFALVLLGNLIQEVLLNYMPYVNMVNYGGQAEQAQGLIALMIPVIALYVLYKVVMGIVHKFLYRKGEW